MATLRTPAPKIDPSKRIGRLDPQFTYSKGDSTPATVYLIASASKWLSSAVFMSVVESGALSLDDHPQDYLPFWTTDPNDPRSRITLEQLLSFTSGLPRDVACPMLTTTDCAEKIHTERTELQIPPGALDPYGVYVFIVGALQRPGTEPYTHSPFRYGYPFATAEALTEKVMP